MTSKNWRGSPGRASYGTTSTDLLLRSPNRGSDAGTTRREFRGFRVALEARTVPAIATATTPAADRSDGEQIEGMECVSESFTVEQEVAWVLGGTAGNPVRNGGGETQPVDAGGFDRRPF